MSLKATTKSLFLVSLFSIGCGGSTEGVSDSDGEGGDGNARDADEGAGAGEGNGASSGDGDGDGDGDGSGAAPAHGAASGTGAEAGSGGSGGSGATGSGGTGNECVPGISITSQVPRLRNDEYAAAVKELVGFSSLGDSPFSQLNDDYEGSMDPYSWNGYQVTGRDIASAVMAGADKSKFIACDPAEAGCFEETIVTFGRKAFRRPLTADEVERFMMLTSLEPQGTPDEIAETILNGFLISPSFIMLAELNDEMEGSSFTLSSYETATRLSMLLWGSLPDEELNAAADAGELSTKEQILTQAARMLQDREKTGPQIVRAHQAYLRMHTASHWFRTNHDSEIYPEFSEQVWPTMQAEFDAFIEEVAFSEGSFEDLFLSNVGFVNNEIAAIYDLNPEDFTSALERVEFDSDKRPGMLSRSAFLSSFSNFDATSPVLRGAFITVNVLGVDPGPPDPESIATPIPPGNYSTRREEMEALTSFPGCASCHQVYIDPPGFILENYNAVGKWQTRDQLGGEINSIATVIFDQNDKDGVVVETPLELMQGIVDAPNARRLYVERILSFAYRRQPNSNDACGVDELTVRLNDEGYTILELFTDLTQFDSFRLRMADN